MRSIRRRSAGRAGCWCWNRAQGIGHREQGLVDAMFRDLPNYLRAGDLLVLNDSRVLPARLFATRAGVRRQANSPQPSGVVEVLLVEEVDEPGAGNREHRSELVWRALVKPARKVRVGETLEFHGAGRRGPADGRGGGGGGVWGADAAVSPPQ